MGVKKTERLSVWLTPEQIDWLKTKGKNTSETLRALVTEAMNLDRLAQSVKRRKRRTSGRGSGSTARSR